MGQPPFKMLPQVVAKIQKEACRLALCTPEWDHEAWWAELQKIPHQVQRLPPRRRLFFGGYRKTALPQKAWRTVVWLLDNRAKPREEGSTGKGLSELKEALSNISVVHWSHGLKGGKPMIPNRHLTPKE